MVFLIPYLNPITAGLLAIIMVSCCLISRSWSASKGKMPPQAKGADLGGFDADTINKATSLNMIAGGSDTTMVTLTWAIALLLNNHHKLKRAQDELDAEIGRERIVSESDMSKLVYIQAIVKETLRLYPAAPLSVPHEFTEDCTIGGYNVLKGTRLITNLWKMQTDPKMWPDDPLGFKPERFLTTHRDVDVRGSTF
ncbi:hypothetical protein M0R45_016805 [Rubus argutus]|uniref:Cytochrome P450 n=1 Tax=Rubus argutus TaxID=59490 RepID=A0AAW1XUL4_RUBAR